MASGIWITPVLFLNARNKRFDVLFIGVNIMHQFTARCLVADSMHDRIHGWHNGASNETLL